MLVETKTLSKWQLVNAQLWLGAGEKNEEISTFVAVLLELGGDERRQSAFYE